MVLIQAPSPPDELPPHTGPKTYFTVQRHCFAVIGIDPTSLERTIFNRFLAWVPFFSIFALCGPMIMLGINNMDDLNKMANAIAPMWQSMISLVKFTLFMWNKKSIIQLVRRIWFRNLEANDKELQIIAEENRLDYNISLFYYVLVVLTGTLAFIVPFIIAGFYAWNGYSYFESLEMPLKGQYPLDSHKSYWNYAFNFIWNILGIHYVTSGTLAMDSLFSWFMRNISAQFRILNLRFSAVADEAKVRKAQGIYTDEEITISLIECVKNHRNVMDLADQFNSVYGTLVFVQFLISCLQLASLTFQFSQGGEMFVQLFNLSFLMAVTTQLMLYCYGGQRIQDLSTSVESNIYESFRWHDISVRSKTTLLYIMMRAQKPCTVMGVLFVADMSLFVWVFRTAGSFLTMMLSVDKREE